MDDATLWPPTAVRVSTGDTALVYADDALLLQVARVAAAGVHDEDTMPFPVSWTRGSPLQVARSVLAFQWGARANITPESWRFELVVLHAGEPVGMQGATARDFPVVGQAETGSWLGRDHQGRGIGRTMRLLVLHLLFEGLGARAATTSAFEDNAASNAVTRTLGYAPDGEDLVAREGRPARVLRYRLSRADWDTRPATLRPEVEMTGIAPLRSLLGLPHGPD
ncbi:MAG: GNAT family N-acetyltransferase [Actinobacteria bacterium]|nr:GNAT family N-acetyltransferase [Actinomycetota bacterium]MCG2801797.1 GNAT family N-acetyltransferase [Cellulomonas sp.]